MAKKKSELYSNGIVERFYSDDDAIPDGFTKCRVFYINDGVSNKRWYNENTIPDGFVKGKLPISRNWEEDKHKHHSEETKKKISDSRKKNTNDWWIGKHHSEETRSRISDKKCGTVPWNKGLKLTESQKEEKQSNIINRYGSLNNFHELVSKKRKQTKLERYGNENYNNREKASKTTYEHFGVDYYCMLSDFRKGRGIDSKPNNDFEAILRHNNIEFSREFPMHKKQYDFKVGNTLIEINPSVTHNSTFGVYYDDPKDKNYHKRKSLLAEENGYRCIHIWDWDDKSKIINLIGDKAVVYARKCSITSLSKIEADEFLKENHLQGTCNGQSIVLGLFYNDKLIQIMTFGKPRYNKNYQYELLRLCTKTGYKVVGGSEKLFDYFVKNYNPQSVISYCDKSKFTGDVYIRLGFTLKSNGNPSKHWYNLKTKQHITDNLLRQKGFDKLFGTNFGKGSSNEDLMKSNGFVEIYDCGQASYAWNKLR